MAITRSQQARQMYKTAGAVEQDGSLNFIKNSESVTVPKEFKARKNAPATKLAYITADEAKMLKKKKPGTPHKGPKGIPSYDTFGSIDASGKDTGVAGTTASAAETGGRTERDRADFRAAGLSPQDVQDLRSAAIASGAGQRVNPGFFDSRDTVSPQELALARAFNPDAFARNRRGGIMDLFTSGGVLGNIIRGIGQKAGLGKRFNQPTYDMRQFSDIGLLTDRVNPNNLDIYNEFVDDENDTQTITFDPTEFNTRNKPNIDNLIAFESGSKKDIRLKSLFKEKGLTEDLGIPFPAKKEKELQELLKEDKEQTEFPKTELLRAADGGRIGAIDGGIMGGLADGQMDEMGRQMYGLGKLVKKATRAVKKIAKSPIGKAALLYTGAGALGNLAGGSGLAGMFKGFTSPSAFLGRVPGIFSKGGLDNIMSGLKLGKFVGPPSDRVLEKNFLGKFLTSPTGLITAASAVAGMLTPEQEDQAQQLADETGIDIEAARNSILQAAKENYAMDVRARGFKADGGLMRMGYQEGSKEPVAKKTMPLLDMDGKEKDYRETGGFVDMGRMERADDVPARLSKNEFVFTADAVRNAGDGDIDKGAEVMYNMMKNLEAGGEVSEESQGLEGARRMFQTSQRLEEVI